MKRYCICTFFFISLLALLVPEIISRGEAREALVLQSLIQGGTFTGVGYEGVVPSKPPMLHYFGLAIFKVITLIKSFFGIASYTLATGSLSLFSFSLRVPSFIFGLGALFLLSRLSPAVWLVLLSYEWFRHMYIARVDMVHSASLACAFYFIYRILHPLREQSNKFAYVGLWISLVCASLAKGFVAIILAVGVVCVEVAYPMIILGMVKLKDETVALKDKRFCAIWRILKLLTWDLFKQVVCQRIVTHLIILSASVPLLLWYYIAYLEHGQAFIEKFWYENVNRFTSSMHDSPHEHGVLYLSLLLALALIIPAIFAFLGKSGQKSEVRQSARFSLVCSLVVFAFYAIPSSKRSVYLLVSLPFWTIYVADRLEFSFEFLKHRLLGWGQRKIKFLLNYPRFALLSVNFLCIISFSLYFAGFSKLADNEFAPGCYLGVDDAFYALELHHRLNLSTLTRDELSELLDDSFRSKLKNGESSQPQAPSTGPDGDSDLNSLPANVSVSMVGPSKVGIGQRGFDKIGTNILGSAELGARCCKSGDLEQRDIACINKERSNKSGVYLVVKDERKFEEVRNVLQFNIAKVTPWFIALKLR